MPLPVAFFVDSLVLPKENYIGNVLKEWKIKSPYHFIYKQISNVKVSLLKYFLLNSCDLFLSVLEYTHGTTKRFS